MSTCVGSSTRISYFKRYKMEVDLRELPRAKAPIGFSFLPWQVDQLETHAELMFQCFQREIDAVVFPSFADRLGCSCLMTEITTKRTFEPSATWLLVGPEGPCGTVQGLRERTGIGAIQNLGIIPDLRGRGLGSVLLLQALQGFYHSGLGRASLEVTAQNDGAIRLYRRLGFRSRKTLYKAVVAAPEIPEFSLPLIEDPTAALAAAQSVFA